MSKDKPDIEAELSGKDLMSDPVLNKGTAFTDEELTQFELHGLLPPVVETLEQQCTRAYEAYKKMNDDLEQLDGLPPTVHKIKDLMLPHQGFLISSSEYNSSISGLLKNTIDWASRKRENEIPLACFTHKVAGLMSASPGGLGGLRGLVHARAILGNIGVLVIPEQIAAAKAYEAFNADGTMKNKDQEEQVKKIGANVTKLLVKLTS